ncbi:SPOUT methyltransferase, predicted [sediment metagenome]|uniref:SPOUT methyltransferase, predicted n=1 Tax=sediment metagenome TaxID=749907 RepID=D9PIN1_9ZZZZ
MKLQIITIGEPKNEYKKIFDEYLKRLSGFVKLEYYPIKEDKNSDKKIFNLIEKTFVILLDEKGREFSSKSLAEFLEKKELESVGTISFLIGGPDGHNEEIRKKEDFKISFSRLTFPHDLAMVILVETLYRSFSIINNHPYHREG